MASTAGSNLGSGGVFFSQKRRRRDRGSTQAGGDGAGGASGQGGAGSGGRGGWIHVSDQRNPPDYGRIAWPEDILGSLEVDGEGNFVGDKGEYQSSGTCETIRLCMKSGGGKPTDSDADSRDVSDHHEGRNVSRKSRSMLHVL